jgi:ribonuclease HII
MGALNGMRWSKDMTKNRKKMIYKIMVKSVLIYGAETWSLCEDDKRRINAAEMEVLRRPARISKLNRKTNEYIREKMEAPDTVLDEITRKKVIWYGHFERMDPTRSTKIMINWKSEGRKNEVVPEGPGKMGYIQQ